VLKGSLLSSTLTATTSDCLPFLIVERDLLSTPNRRTVLDSNGNHLFSVRKEGLGTRHYYAEAAGGGERLFDVVTEVKLLKRSRTEITVANNADFKRAVLMVYIPTGRRGGDSLFWNNSRVAIVERKAGILSEYHLLITAGMDPTLVTGIMVALIDRKKTQAGAAAAAWGVA
jgi:uncharacterized protein YxjI